MFLSIHMPHGTLPRKLQAFALAAMTALAAASCSDSSDGPDDGTGTGSRAEVDAGFVITLSSGGVDRSGSRAPSEPEGGYDPGAGYENYIDIDGGDFRFLFFDKDNRYTGTFDVTTIEQLSETKTSKRYYVAGNVAKELVDDKELKVLALANWRSYEYENGLTPGVTTIDDVCRQTYAYHDFLPAGESLSAKNIIPLYGVTNLLSLTPSTTNRIDLGQINLLRAFAKIEVIRAEDGL
ncbi:MAG: FimB/Mfa2 family fimbrial subunit, partial [Muribaculaceae bacterium]|nr:FimB/Mfa2 family fimbrial subunit [Muribaculaceae bacterium]